MRYAPSYNKCPHQPHALAKQHRGHFSGHLACSQHQLDFALSGRSRNPHDHSRLQVLDVNTSSGLIYVGSGMLAAPGPACDAIASPGAGFSPQAGLGFAEYDVAADWKIAIEQLLTHCLPDHESIGGVQRFTPPVVQVELERGRVSWQATPVSAENWSARRLATLVTARRDQAWQRCYLWPNLLFESRADGLSALQVIPLTVGTCRVQRFDHWRIGVAAADQAIRYLVSRLADQALRVDRDLAASTQRGGLACRATRPTRAHRWHVQWPRSGTG